MSGQYSQFFNDLRYNAKYLTDTSVTFLHVGRKVCREACCEGAQLALELDLLMDGPDVGGELARLGGLVAAV